MSSIHSFTCILLLFVVHSGLVVLASTNDAAKEALKTVLSSSRPSVNKWAKDRRLRARELANLEQQVEDYNAEWAAGSKTPAQGLRHRRLICLPLTDNFDPPMGHPFHGHLQTGDKMSVPNNFLRYIKRTNPDVPYLFSVSRIPGVTSERVEFINPNYNKDDGDVDDEKSRTDVSEIITPHIPVRALDKVVGSAVDYRAPSCYVFLPWWMMRSLGVRPLDIVEVEYMDKIPSGALVKFRPHSRELAEDFKEPQAVLEMELKHYTSFTEGSTIAFDFNKKRYWVDVVECRAAPTNERKPMIKAMDCDLRTEFLPSRDVVLERKRKRREREQQQQDL